MLSPHISPDLGRPPYFSRRQSLGHAVAHFGVRSGKLHTAPLHTPTPALRPLAQVLREEEFETLDELAALGDKEWEALPLPLAVRAKIRHALASPPPLAPPTPLAPSAPLVPAPAPPPEPPSTTGRSRVLASRNVPSPTAMAAPIVGLGGNWGLESPLLASFLAVFFQALWCVRPFRRAVLALPPSNEKIASSVKLLMSSLFGQRTASPKSLLRAAFPPSLLDKALPQDTSLCGFKPRRLLSLVACVGRA